MEMLQGVWKQHLRPRAVVGYGVKIFLPSPPNYVTRSPGWGLVRPTQTALTRKEAKPVHKLTNLKFQIFLNFEIFLS